MPLDRPALHCAADGLDLAARKLLLEPIVVPPNAMLVCFMRNEALLDEAELDRKLTRAYGLADGDGWLASARALLHEEGRRVLALLQEEAHRVLVQGPAVGMTRKTPLQQGAEIDDRSRLLALPPAEFLTAIEYALELVNSELRPSVCAQLEDVLKKRLLPYTIDSQGHISWVGEPAVRQLAIEPALSALSDPRLSTARVELDQARGHLRRAEFKDAGRWAGDAVETTMAVLLGAHGYPQPQTKHGTDLVLAHKLFDRLKSTAVGLLNEDRDHALIFAPMKVRHACGHDAGANPSPPDPTYVEAGVAAAAVAITYLASKLPCR